jgi:F420H(2)-dependent quinone reductase
VTTKGGVLHNFGVRLLRTVMREIGDRSGSYLRRFIRVMSILHMSMYRVTGGHLGRRLGLRRARIVMLTTTGRKSGVQRTVPLLSINDGDDIVVTASHGGLDEPPGWWLNLLTNRSAIAEVAGRRTNVVAKQVDGPRRAELWQRFVDAFPGYEDYQRRTTREIPVVVLMVV